MERMHVAVVDDSLEWIKIIERKIAKQNDFILSWTATSEKEAVEKAKQPGLETDIIIMDINMNEDRLSGIKAAIQIRQFSSAKIVMLSSMQDEEIIKQALSVVIEDYIFKEELEELAFRLRRVYKGNRVLQVASKEINHLKKEEIKGVMSEEVRKLFDLLMQGYKQTEAQTMLTKSIDTIKTQTKKIHKSLKVRSTKDAINKVNTLGLLEIYDEKDEKRNT